MKLYNSFVNFLRVQKRKYRFNGIIESYFGKAVGWSHAAPVLALVKDKVAKLANLPPLNPTNGAPDLNALKAATAKQMAVDLQNAAGPDTYLDLVDTAHYLASCDPGDLECFELLLALFWLAHENTIAELKKIRAPFIIVHMTCAARLEKADTSLQSFMPLDAADYYQLKLIGNGNRHSRFDAAAQIVEVPVNDGYSELSSKMFFGFLLLSLSCNPSAIVKVDDDHRLNHVDALIRFVEQIAAKPNAAQMGCRMWTPFPSAHNRAWHLGKTKKYAPVEMPTPLSFIKGGGGYILNRPALWRLSWAAFYYKGWIKDIMHEDVAISEVGEKLWIEKVNADLRNAIISAG